MSDLLRQQLEAPFAADDLKWKVQASGIKKSTGEIWAQVVPYVDARAVMTRLDAVFGLGGWRVRYTPLALGAKGGFLCELSVLHDGQWISREDGADLTEVEPIKGGISQALRRAAVAFGIGAYLYHAPRVYAEIGDERPFAGVHKDKRSGERTTYKWGVPARAVAALVEGRAAPAHEASARPSARVTVSAGGETPAPAPAAAPKARRETAARAAAWPTACPQCGAGLWDNRKESNPNMKCKAKDCQARVYADGNVVLPTAGAIVAPRDGDDDEWMAP